MLNLIQHLRLRIESAMTESVKSAMTKVVMYGMEERFFSGGR